ncbi:Lsr2 family DNA-binding protein [Pedococcus sp. 5OH_020]|uniref:Lsr2 family DNA-binding protein n=1 Tax=Pedococcus sp. 5OH_020 TaxID=2989814 RepID=UPI0022E9EB94|nr:histone-like nucleoid-structuring protein Lsr2 [Pedococcus sp. 5OH_020]
MKVTIDSTEPLDDALRVIGAVYKVRLNVVDDTAEAQGPGAVASPLVAAPEEGKPSQRSTPRPSRRRRQNTTSKRDGRNVLSVSVSEMRSWALANGHRVSARGTLPTSVTAAYADAHSG